MVDRYLIHLSNMFIGKYIVVSSHYNLLLSITCNLQIKLYFIWIWNNFLMNVMALWCVQSSPDNRKNAGSSPHGPPFWQVKHIPLLQEKTTNINYYHPTFLIQSHFWDSKLNYFSFLSHYPGLNPTILLL
jgi:hypothetical protein